MFDHFKLDNGIVVIAQPMPAVRSVSLGLWIRTGSCYETPIENGISHFIEHMLFKGTQSRTSVELAEAIEFLGGQINAFTAKDSTCYYFKVLDEHLPIGIDILSDMLLHSKFDPKEIKKEASVIKEEISMYEDSPEDLTYDLLSEVAFKDTAYAQCILGTNQTVDSFAHKGIKAYLKTHYTTENMVISVAGSYDLAQLKELLNSAFHGCSVGVAPFQSDEIIPMQSGFKFKLKDIEQHHLILGFPGIPFGSAAFYTMLLLNNAFGGNTTSRLFQTIREDHALAYSVYSSPSFYPQAGILTLYASYSPENATLVIEKMCEEILKFARNGMLDDEIHKLKEQLKGSYVLSLESTGSLMSMLGKRQLHLGYVETLDEVIQGIQAVTKESVTDLIQHIFDGGLSVALVGKCSEEEAQNYYDAIIKGLGGSYEKN
jgi:predicted Zn-dependent peptidase